MKEAKAQSAGPMAGLTILQGTLATKLRRSFNGKLWRLDSEILALGEKAMEQFMRKSNTAAAATWMALSLCLLGKPAFAEPAESSQSPAAAETPTGDPTRVMETLSTGAQVNEFTAQAAFSLPLGAISNQGGISFPVALKYYGGGLEHRKQTKPEFNPIPWVGEGFSLAAPSVTADKKGTASLLDDEYFLSLDGQTPTLLIPEKSSPAGNPDFFYPKNNPFIMVKRIHSVESGVFLTDPRINVIPGVYPLTNPNVSIDQIRGWEVSMPNGTRYLFGSNTSGCDGTNEYSFCALSTGEHLGYQPFYNFDAKAMIPVQWFLREIRSTDDKFSIFCRYFKVSQTVTGIAYNGGANSPTVSVDRAIYLESIYSVNGTLATDLKIQEMRFERETRNPVDFADNSAIDVLARFEAERLKQVRFFLNGGATSQRTLELLYSTSSEYSRTRLRAIQEHSEGATRGLYTFSYDISPNGWRMKKVKSPNGLEWEYLHGPLANAFLAPHTIDLNQVSLDGGIKDLIGPYDEARVFMHQEVGTKLYLGVEEGFDYGPIIGVCDGNPTDARFVRRLIELENNGTYWSVNRVFVSDYTGCPQNNPVVVAPDGSYMAWARPGAGASHDLRLYSLKPKSTTSELIVLAGYTCADPTGFVKFCSLSGHIQAGSSSNIGNLVLMPFPNWLMAHNSGYKLSASFFHKNEGGTWQSARSGGTCAVPVRLLGASIWSYLDEGIDHSDCITWDDPIRGEVEVRPGNNFVVARFNEKVEASTARNGSTIRVYSYQNNAYKEYIFGLRKSRLQKGTSDRQPMISNYSLLSPEQDMDFLWDPILNGTGSGDLQIMDLAVNGDLIGVIVGSHEGLNPGGDVTGRPKYLYLFAWDGQQLRYLYQEVLPSSGDITGPHLYLGDNYFIYKNPTLGNAVYYTINRKAWMVEKQTGVNFLPSSVSTIYKVWNGYFHVESIPPSQRHKAFAPALVISTENTYPGGSGRLYRINPVDGLPVPVDGLSPVGNFAENFVLRGDRFLGVKTNTTVSPALHSYVYGYLTAGGGVQTQWVGSSMAAVLTGSGVMVMKLNHSTDGTTGPISFNGNLQFHGDFGGSLLNVGSSPPNVVTGVILRTKSNASNAADGSLRQIDLSYVFAPRFNHLGKTFNMSEVRATGGEKELVTDYFIDYTPGNPVSHEVKVLHGQVKERTFRSADVLPGGEPGKVNQVFLYKIRPYAKGASGGDLRETIDVSENTRARTVLKHFNATLTTESRTAMPNPQNGTPQVTVTQKGSEYHVSVVRFNHEFPGATATSKVLAKQTAAYLFKTDPCTGSGVPENPDPCANFANQDFSFFLPATSPNNAKRAVASQVRTYNANGSVNTVHNWKPKQLGSSGLATLDGTTPATDYATQGKWIQASSVLSRAGAQATLLCKHEGPTEIDAQGVAATIFYGGREGRSLATVKNARKFISTYLGAEEEAVGGNFGSFGDWEGAPGRIVSSEVVHTGKNSVKITTEFGPTVNLYYRQDDAGFWNRKKGILVSGWVYASGIHNGDNAKDSKLAAVIEFRSSPTTHARPNIDLIADYENATQGPLPYNRWVKLERLITWDELNAFTSNASHFLRIWFGKQSPAPNALPVYVDDLRVHPSDAVMTSSAYDDKGRLSSTCDADNHPTHRIYDAWGQAVAVKDDKGRLFSTSASKRIGD